MKRYKEEVDALHADDALRQSIAALAQNTPAPVKKKPGRHIAVIAAVLAVVLLVGVIGVPAMFAVTRKSATDEMAAYGSVSDRNDSFGEYAESVAVDTSDYKYTAASATARTSEEDAAAAALPADRKLIRDAELNVETKTYDQFMTDVNKQVAALHGYVQSTDAGTNYSGSRYSTMVLRIPADSLDAFLQFVAEAGTVTYESTSVQDVTDDYIDIESRIAALETEQQTLLDLLKKAEDLTDTLEIQDRLSEVRGSLESYKGRMKALESKIAYSAVTIRLEEVERITPPEGKTFFEQVRANLSDNLYSIGQGFRSFAIGFLSGMPYILLWLVFIGVIVLVAVLIVRRIRRRR